MRNYRLTIVALIFMLAAATASMPAQDSNVTNDASSAAAIPGYSWLQINAFTSTPLAGADVAVYDTGGNVLFQRDAATNDQGVYAAYINNLPRDFRVTVSFDGNSQQDPGLAALGRFQLSADARNFDPEYGVVYVNPATTLADLAIERLPTHDLRMAKILVRRFLVLPQNIGLGDALRQGPYYQSPYFSESAFLTQAGQQGGLDPYLNYLLREMLTPPFRTHSFAGPPTATVRNPLAFIAVNLASGALQYIGGQGVGWVMSFGGKPAPPGATKEDIERVQAALADLQASVDGLSEQLEALTELIERKFTETQLHIITVNALPLATRVNGIERNVSFYAQRCPPILETGDASGSEPADPYCTDRRKTIEAQLRESAIDHSFDTFSSYLLDKKALGSTGMIHLYSLSLGQTVRFFRPADSTKIEDMFEYWKSVQTQSANLHVELLHLDGVQNGPPGHNELIEFLGKADADPPTQGRFQNTLAAEQKLVFPAVPAGTVINTKDRTMWATSYPPFSGRCNSPFPQGNTPDRPPLNVAYLGLMHWNSPTVSEAEALIAGWKGATPNQWLIEQTRAVAPEEPTSAGFPRVIYVRGNCSFTSSIWTRDFSGKYTDSPYEGGGKIPVNYLLDLENGKVLDNYFGGVGGHSNFAFVVRGLNAGEQYYWYQ